MRNHRESAAKTIADQRIGRMKKLKLGFGLSTVFFLSVGGCNFFSVSKVAPQKQAVELSSESSENLIPRGIASSPGSLQRYKDYDDEIKCTKEHITAGRCRVESQCSNEIQRKISNYGAERSWTKMPGGTDGSASYFSPTREVGRWVRVRKYQSGQMQFAVLKKDATETWNYSSTCSATTSERSRAFFHLKDRPGLELFTDADLEALIVRTSDFGVIYVWSPGMGYSYQRNSDPYGAYRQTDDSGQLTSGIKNTQDAMAAVRDKLAITMRFTVLVDPSVHRSDIDRVLRGGNHDLTDQMLKRMTAFDLLMRQMGQHYPSLVVYGNGKIYRLMQPGLSTTESYRQFIEGAVLALQKN